MRGPRISAHEIPQVRKRVEEEINRAIDILHDNEWTLDNVTDAADLLKRAVTRLRALHGANVA